MPKNAGPVQDLPHSEERSADAVKATRSDIENVARDKLGFENLRAGQMEAVQSVLKGRDTLIVQPTGSGKSAIYQIAGLLIEGCTVVVSPLIALQKDQVDSIAGLGLDESAAAAAVNSTKRVSEIEERRRQIEHGEIEYIFLAPEQLRKPETIETLKRAGISLFVVDEAHCISEWGHDFRADYLRLGNVIEALGHPRVLALTATASPVVRAEIVERLGMRQPKIMVRGFDRPNIYLRVDRFETEPEKRDALVHRVVWAEKPGIVYVGTRKAAEEIMEALAQESVSSLFYHGGLRGKEREEIQEKFMSGGA
jgi:ATP-dependent DNA helicase RecQ